jgi:hypothetical protein
MAFDRANRDAEVWDFSLFAECREVSMESAVDVRGMSASMGCDLLVDAGEWLRGRALAIVEEPNEPEEPHPAVLVPRDRECLGAGDDAAVFAEGPAGCCAKVQGEDVHG